jgi:hypothetical protein
VTKMNTEHHVVSLTPSDEMNMTSPESLLRFFYIYIYIYIYGAPSIRMGMIRSDRAICSHALHVTRIGLDYR